MAKKIKKELSANQINEILGILQIRFDNNKKRHIGLDWSKISVRLKKNTQKLWSLNEMEKTGGEPDVIGYDKKTDEYIFCDCVSRKFQKVVGVFATTAKVWSQGKNLNRKIMQ